MHMCMHLHDLCICTVHVLYVYTVCVCTGICVYCTINAFMYVYIRTVPYIHMYMHTPCGACMYVHVNVLTEIHKCSSHTYLLMLNLFNDEKPCHPSL